MATKLTLYDLVLHPQLGPRALNMFPVSEKGEGKKKIPGALLIARAASSTVQEQVDNFLMEVVTEALFYHLSEHRTNNSALIEVPYYSNDLLAPFFGITLGGKKNMGKETDDLPLSFYSELERRLNPELKFIGPIHHFDQAEDFKKIATKTNLVEKLPPFPEVLSLLTQERLPDLLLLAFSPHLFQNSTLTKKFFEHPSSIALLQQVTIVDIDIDVKRVSEGSHRWTPLDEQLLRSKSVSLQDFATLMTKLRGGNFKRLVMSQLNQDRIADVVACIGRTVGDQLECLSLAHDYGSGQKKGKEHGKEPYDKEEVAACQELVEQHGAKLKSLQLYMGEYSSDPNWEPMHKAVAAHCPQMTTLYLPSWTLGGIQAVARSLGHSITNLGGLLTTPTKKSLPEIIKVISEHCPKLEKCGLITSGIGCVDEEKLQLVRSLFRGCPKLKDFKCAVPSIDMLDSVLSLLTPAVEDLDVELMFAKGESRIDEVRFASLLCHPTICESVKQLSVTTGYFEPPRCSDQLFASMMQSGRCFRKVNNLALTFDGISAEAVLAMVSKMCPRLQKLRLGRPLRRKADTPAVTPESAHEAIRDLRGKGKIIPTAQSNPVLEKVTGFAEDELTAEDKERGHVEVILQVVDGVDLRNFETKVAEDSRR